MKHKYALMTAARNEDQYILKTLQAVVNQTVLPARWIIINDNSVDNTQRLVEEFSAKYDFIELVNLTGNEQRDFSSKVYAINKAYILLKNDKLDYLGILDADISFDADYYEKILSLFEQNPKMALAGGTRYDLVNGKFEKVNIAQSSVGGPIQLFKKSVFDEIGGFLPLKYGGEDAVAEIMVRKLGYHGKSFPEIKVYHYRPTGSEGYSSIKSSFRLGIRFRLIGYHPLFHIFRSIGRIPDNPFLFGALSSVLGYFYAQMRLSKSKFPTGYIEFLHKEQMDRLKSYLFKGRDILNK